MTAPTNGLGLVGFEGEKIKNDKSLVEELQVFQRTVSNDKTAQEGVEKA